MSSLLGSPPVYLVDFSVYKPPEELRVVKEKCREEGKDWKVRRRGTACGAACCLLCKYNTFRP